MRTLRSAAAFLVLVLAVVAMTDCQQVIGIPDRVTRPNLVCVDGNCACAVGFGDCDANLANGCETDVRTDQQNCGACGLACTNGACAASHCTCNAGFADCDADPKNGCEIDLGTDPKNCGSCGHDCHGGGCAASLCTPLVLASNTSYSAVVLVGGELYWIDDSGNSPTIDEMSASGGSLKTVATINANLNTLTASSTLLYAASSSILYRVDPTTGDTSMIYAAPMGDEIEAIAATDTTLFMQLDLADLSQEIIALDLSSLMTTTVSTDVETTGSLLPLWKGQPVWINTEEGGVSTVINGTAMEIAKSPTIVDTVTADDQFIWATSATTASDATFFRIDPMTGEMLAGPEGNLNESVLAANGSTLVWSDMDGNLGEWDGTTVTNLAQGFNVFNMVVDADNVYATTGQGIERVAR